jgi:creatinine amidohydrolase
MRHLRLLIAPLTLLAASALTAQVRQLGQLTTRQIEALDRAHTVVFLTGGMIEEHGPYLPAYTDGILSERLTDTIASALVRGRPGWTALRLPTIGVGASGYNEISGRFAFPGTYAVRPSTLRAMYMDLASELGEQGFRTIVVVHVHGSPMHITALDDAGDFFRDTYGGRMVNLWGLIPVLAG